MTVTESPTSKSRTLTSTFSAALASAVGPRIVDDLVDGQRGRLVGVPDEAGDARGVAHGTPRLVGEVHADQDVAGELVAPDQLALAVLDLDDLLLRDLDLVDEVLHVQRGRAALEVGLHPVLVPGVGVHDVPVARARRAASAGTPRPGRPAASSAGSASAVLGGLGRTRPSAVLDRRRRSSAAVGLDGLLASLDGSPRRRRVGSSTPSSRAGGLGHRDALPSGLLVARAGATDRGRSRTLRSPKPPNTTDAAPKTVVEARTRRS